MYSPTNRPITGSSVKKTLHRRLALAGIFYIVSFLLQNLYVVNNKAAVQSHAQVVYQDFTTTTRKVKATSTVTARSSSDDVDLIASTSSSTEKVLLETNESVEPLPNPNEIQNDQTNLTPFNTTATEFTDLDESSLLEMTLEGSGEEVDSMNSSSNWTTAQQGQETNNGTTNDSKEDSGALGQDESLLVLDMRLGGADEEANYMYHTNLTTTQQGQEQSQNGTSALEDAMEGRPSTETSTTDHTHLYNLHEGNERVVFYNIYIPWNESLRPGAIAIVQEQLEQIGNSTATSFKKGGLPQYIPTIIYYNTIGRPLNPSFMDRACKFNHLKCYHLEHLEAGFESITLEDVHQFCIMKTSGNTTNSTNDPENTSDANNRKASNISVVYLHNKGSFHEYKNTKAHLRRSMTTAVMSQECHMALESGMCNTCGLMFSPWRSPFFPGNFWTAKCDYVKQLLPPIKYQREIVMHLRSARTMRRRGKLRFNLFSPIPSTLATGRYAAEFWVGSHPTIRPCDVAPDGNYGRWLWRDLKIEDIDLQKSPRIPNWQLEGPDILGKIPQTATYRFKEYFLLAGYIMRWHRLYDQVPPNDSWVWGFYPEGNIWRDAVKNFGKRAVRKLINHGEGRTVNVISHVTSN